MPNGYATANGGKRPDNELSLDEIATLIQGFCHTRHNQSTSNRWREPSIRHDLPQIIELAKQTQGIKTVAVSSNGYRLAKHLTVDLKTAGLDKLNISIDSFNPAVFKQITGFDILPTLLKDIDKLLESTEIHLKLNGILKADTAFDNLQNALVCQRLQTYRFIEFMCNSELFFAEHASGKTIKNHLLEKMAGQLPNAQLTVALRISLVMMTMWAKSDRLNRMHRNFAIAVIVFVSAVRAKFIFVCLINKTMIFANF